MVEQGGSETMTIVNGRPVPTAAQPGGTGPRQVTIMLADEHAVVREGLRSLLTVATGIAVVAEAETARDVVVQTPRLRPDVLLLGLRLPQHRLSSLIREVLLAVPRVAVLVFSARDDAEAVSASIRAGARGYISTGTNKEEIIRSVRGLAGGWAVFSPAVAGSLAGIVSGSAEVERRPFPKLTDREYEILNLVAAGMSNLTIALRLNVAPKTISNHVSKIFIKLGVTDRANAIVRARDAGLGRVAG